MVQRFSAIAWRKKALLMALIAPLLLFTGALSACSRQDGDAIRNLEIPVMVADGESASHVLHARLYQPVHWRPEADAAPPGLLLIHRPGSNHKAWERFALRARGVGYMLLAVDLRGHGESTAPVDYPATYRDFERSHWMECLEDISAARDALLAAGANPENIGVMGEGLSANLATYWYRRNNDIQALVALSPGLDYEGIRTEPVVRELQYRPVLYLAGEDDSYSVRSATSLRDMTPGFAELRTFQGFAFGAEIFEHSANAMEITLQWLDGILKHDEDVD